MSSGKATVTLPADEEILITREFEAPRHLVYKAFTTPDLVRRWWHAKRGEVTVVEIDLRVGGRWRYVMVTDDGAEVGFHGEYREIVHRETLAAVQARAREQLLALPADLRAGRAAATPYRVRFLDAGG